MTLHNHINHKLAGFTLLELLVVTAVLAILAGAVINSYSGIQEQGQYDVAVYEMAEIRKALIEFRRDSGSNDFPGQGIYDCSLPALYSTAQLNETSTGDNWPSGAPSANSNLSDWQDWCSHPANFWMLFINPYDELSTTNNEEGGWNRDTKRGWNGPYLKRNAGFVDIYDTIASDGDPSSGYAVIDIWGIASPFISSNPTYLWRSVAGDADTDLEQFGSPYFMFDLDDDGNNPSSPNPARLVSLATNNSYDGDNNSDCSQSQNQNGLPHDHVLCLLR